MIDYWNKLKLDECWSKKQRFNIMMNYINGEVNSTNQDEEEEVKLGDISVSITNEENQGIGNAQVLISKDTTEFTGSTGNAGGCTIKNVPYDTYSVVVTANGYEDGEGSITVNADTVELNMTLIEEVGFEVETPTMIEEEGEF